MNNYNNKNTATEEAQPNLLKDLVSANLFTSDNGQESISCKVCADCNYHGVPCMNYMLRRFGHCVKGHIHTIHQLRQVLKDWPPLSKYWNVPVWYVVHEDMRMNHISLSPFGDSKIATMGSILYSNRVVNEEVNFFHLDTESNSDSLPGYSDDDYYSITAPPSLPDSVEPNPPPRSDAYIEGMTDIFSRLQGTEYIESITDIASVRGWLQSHGLGLECGEYTVYYKRLYESYYVLRLEAPDESYTRTTWEALIFGWMDLIEYDDGSRRNARLPSTATMMYRTQSGYWDDFWSGDQNNIEPADVGEDIPDERSDGIFPVDWSGSFSTLLSRARRHIRRRYRH